MSTTSTVGFGIIGTGMGGNRARMTLATEGCKPCEPSAICGRRRRKRAVQSGTALGPPRPRS